MHLPYAVALSPGAVRLVDRVCNSSPHAGLVVESRSRSAGSGTCDEGDDDECGVTVEVLASAVVDRCCAGVGVAGGELHVTQRHTGIERGHDEPGAEHVRVHDSKAASFANRTNPAVSSAAVERRIMARSSLAR